MFPFLVNLEVPNTNPTLLKGISSAEVNVFPWAILYTLQFPINAVKMHNTAKTSAIRIILFRNFRIIDANVVT